MRTTAIILTLLLALSGCTSVLDAVKDEPVRPDPYKTPLGTDINDFQIETGIGVNIKKSHPLLRDAHVNINSFNGVVLLTGEVPDEEMRGLAGETARVFRGVRQVHNELQIQEPTTLGSRSTDSWLTTKVKSKLIAEKTIDSTKVKVITENRIVYLMGIVPKSLGDRAADVASTTKGIRKVVKVFEYPEE